MKWYEETYVNRNDWILDKMGVLGISPEEAVIVLMIEFMNRNRMKITIDALEKRTGISSARIDEVISTLCAKQYLEIRASSKSVRFDVSGLFEARTARDERIMDRSLFDTFETEFGRTLSQREMEKISDWNRTTDKKLILYALREASAYQKLSVAYVDRILAQWTEKGYTAADIEKGVHEWKK